jgi:hypothetical protein
MLGKSSTFLLKILLLPLLFFFASCDSEERPPEDVLPQDKMVAILSEIHIAESRIVQMHLKSMDSSVLMYDYFQKKLYKKHQTDSTQYKNSYDYYASDPKRLEDIYDKVAKKIEARQKKNNIKL